MANKITDLIYEMEDIMEEASSVPFSKKVAVDPDEIYDVLNEMKILYQKKSSRLNG